MEPGPPAGDRTLRRQRRQDIRESAAFSAGLPPPPPPGNRRVTLGVSTDGGSVSLPPSAGAMACFSTPASRLSYSAVPPSMDTAIPFGLPDEDADVEGGAGEEDDENERRRRPPPPCRCRLRRRSPLLTACGSKGDEDRTVRILSQGCGGGERAGGIVFSVIGCY